MGRRGDEIAVSYLQGMQIGWTQSIDRLAVQLRGAAALHGDLPPVTR